MIFSFLRPIIHLIPPEPAHFLTIQALRLGVIPPMPPLADSRLQTQLAGLQFPNPVGMAAGFDKNAEVVDALSAQGFGFIEAGTVTPRAQSGNPKPRIFRLAEDEAVINRLGFNNKGLDVYIRNLSARRANSVVGANIGKNKDSEDAISDYVRGLEAVYPFADYITVNISSPNTPGLRALQHRDALTGLLSLLQEARKQQITATGISKPLFLKIAPDLSSDEKVDIASLAIQHGVDALIISNTTISRPDTLQSRNSQEQGGLSGRPLMALSTDALKEFYRLTNGKIPLIGVGGVANGEDAYAKIRAGASLVQLYSALVYQGFGLVRQINLELLKQLERDGFSHITQAIGADHH